MSRNKYYCLSLIALSCIIMHQITWSIIDLYWIFIDILVVSKLRISTFTSYQEVDTVLKIFFPFTTLTCIYTSHFFPTSPSPSNELSQRGAVPRRYWLREAEGYKIHGSFRWAATIPVGLTWTMKSWWVHWGSLEWLIPIAIELGSKIPYMQQITRRLLFTQMTDVTSYSPI